MVPKNKQPSRDSAAGLGCQDFLFTEKHCVCISNQERQILSYQDLGNRMMLLPGCGFSRLAPANVIALARCTCIIAVVPMAELSAPGHHSEDGTGQLRSHQEQPEVQWEGGLLSSPQLSAIGK